MPRFVINEDKMYKELVLNGKLKFSALMIRTLRMHLAGSSSISMLLKNV